MNSRLIIRNLPKNITEAKLREHFSTKGCITDIQLKYRKDGKFRQFAFIGYKTTEEASKAKEYFDNTYIQNCKLSLDFCKNLFDKESVQKISEVIKKSASEPDKFDELKNDPEFLEFLSVQRNLDKDGKYIWSNDEAHFHTKEQRKKKKEKMKKEKIANDSLTLSNIADIGRIFIRNLCYECTEEDLNSLFEPFGPLSEILLPFDNEKQRIKGFAFVSYVFPEHALKAYVELDGTVFQGRMIHLIPSLPKTDGKNNFFPKEKSSFKRLKVEKDQNNACSSERWNSLFLGMNSVADVMSEKFNIEKSRLLLENKPKESIAVRMALGETQLVNETKSFLIQNGVCIDSFNDPNCERSKTTFLVKNLPAKSTIEDVQNLFSKHGSITKIILPTNGITAIIEFSTPKEARRAFKKSTYLKINNVPLYLEWAPANVFTVKKEKIQEKTEIKCNEIEDKQNISETAKDDTNKNESANPTIKPETNTTIFVKNLNFETTQESLRKHFESIGKLHKVTIVTKKSPNGSTLSMGFGFVQYMKQKKANKALRQLQRSELDGHCLELRLSGENKKESENELKQKRKRKTETEQTGSKMVIKNIPFEANEKEIHEIFAPYGELKVVRLPKKLGGTHRGFGFVEYTNEKAAKKAFEELSASTHLYGRRIIIEWANNEETKRLKKESF